MQISVNVNVFMCVGDIIIFVCVDDNYIIIILWVIVFCTGCVGRARELICHLSSQGWASNV